MSTHIFLRSRLSRETISFILCLVIPTSVVHAQRDPAVEWNELYPKIRDGLITREEAQAGLKDLETQLRTIYREKGPATKGSCLVFPLRGYDYHAIGGKEGNGYRPEGYDFFDGSRHKGHPGHDLFIRDGNQDAQEDDTGTPVEVISASSGVVVSAFQDWVPSSTIRGGNYVWIFEPVEGRYYYYAHLKDVSVKVGQLVSKGEPLGVVGRTGVNAYKKRSPTHLHFTVHRSVDGYPKPINPYPALRRECEKTSPGSN